MDSKCETMAKNNCQSKSMADRDPGLGIGHNLLPGEGGRGSRRIVVVSQWNLPDFSPPPATTLCSISMIPFIGHQFSVFPPPLLYFTSDD